MTTVTTGRLMTLRYGIGRGKYRGNSTTTARKAAITRILNRAGVTRDENGEWPTEKAFAAILAATPARGGAPTSTFEACRNVEDAKQRLTAAANAYATIRAELGTADALIINLRWSEAGHQHAGSAVRSATVAYGESNGEHYVNVCREYAETAADVIVCEAARDARPADGAIRHDETLQKAARAALSSFDDAKGAYVNAATELANLRAARREWVDVSAD